jgi:hypothetical protein
MRTVGISLALLLAACGKPPAANPLAHCNQGLCGDGPVYGIATAQLVASDGKGHSQGFHLVGADTGACPASGFTNAATGTPVDNQVANVLPVLESYVGSALPTYIQTAVNDGGLFLAFEIVGNPETDKTVDVVVHQGMGSPLLGTDGFLLENQTIQIATGTPLGVCTGGTMKNGTLSCGPFTVLIHIGVFQNVYDLTFEETQMTMTFPTDGSDSQVIMGGAVTVANIQAIAAEAGGGAGNLGPVVNNVVPSLADVLDPVNHTCDRISGVLGITARPIFATVQ